MSTNTLFWHHVVHYIAKAPEVYYMRYRLQTWCFPVHGWLKRDNKKENDEIKKIWNNQKELKVNFWDAFMYLKLSILKNSSQ